MSEINQPATPSETPATPPAEELKPSAKDAASPTIGYFTVPEIANSVREDIKRTQYPKWNDSIVTAKTEQAAQQVAAAGALPIDPSNSKADGLILGDLIHARTTCEAKDKKAGEAAESAYAAEQQAAEIQPPLSLYQRLGIVAAVALITIAGVLGLQRLLESSFNEILFREYYESLGISDAETYSAEAASTLVGYLATTLLGSKAVAVIASWGRISEKLKIGLIAVAIAFSACFAVARLALGANWTAIMLSGVEGAILLSFTLLLLVVANVLKADGERADQYRTARTKLAVEVRHADALRQKASEAQDDYHRQGQEIGRREDAARRATLNQDLARKTVAAEALVSYAELISEHAAKARNQSPAATLPTPAETAPAEAIERDRSSPLGSGGGR